MGQPVGGGDEQEAAPGRAQTIEDPIAAKLVFLRAEARANPIGIALLGRLGREEGGTARHGTEDRRHGEERTRTQAAPEPPAPRAVVGRAQVGDGAHRRHTTRNWTALSDTPVPSLLRQYWYSMPVMSRPPSPPRIRPTSTVS